MIFSSRSAKVIAALSAISFGGLQPTASSQQTSLTISTGIVNDRNFEPEQFAKNIKSWNGLGGALWQTENTRALEALGVLLEGLDWDRAKEIAGGVIESFDPSGELKPAQKIILDLARSTQHLELGGSLDITWGSGLSFSIEIIDGCKTKQTEITVTPTIIGLAPDSKFHRTFKPITLFTGPKEGASVLVETFSDPEIVAGYGKYQVKLVIEATARDQNMEGNTVTRSIEHSVDFQKKSVELPTAFNQAAADANKLTKIVNSNLELATKAPAADILTGHPLVQKSFPAMQVEDKDGKVINIDANFWSKAEFSVVKASFIGCPPCRIAEPALEKINEIDGVRGITLEFRMNEKSLAEVRRGHEAELNGKQYKHPALFAEQSSVSPLLVKGFPTYFIVNKEGVIIRVAAGGTLYPAQLTAITGLK